MCRVILLLLTSLILKSFPQNLHFAPTSTISAHFHSENCLNYPLWHLQDLSCDNFINLTVTSFINSLIFILFLITGEISVIQTFSHLSHGDTIWNKGKFGLCYVYNSDWMENLWHIHLSDAPSRWLIRLGIYEVFRHWRPSCYTACLAFTMLIEYLFTHRVLLLTCPPWMKFQDYFTILIPFGTKWCCWLWHPWFGKFPHNLHSLWFSRAVPNVENVTNSEDCREHQRPHLEKSLPNTVLKHCELCDTENPAPHSLHSLKFNLHIPCK